MRNWNFSSPCFASLVIMCFEPTYEELKLFPFLANSKHSLCFEPTYEELKHDKLLLLPFSLLSFWAYLWGIETTKLVSVGVLSGLVLSLPMRNWNFHLACLSLPLVQVLSLPMRNWNFLCFRGGSRSLASFEPTYEELKRLSLKVIFLSPQSFEPTYEELKPLLPIGKPLKCSKFWAYLWGIETDFW